MQNIDATIIVAVIAGVFNIVGLIISTRQSNRDLTNKLDKHQAVQEQKILNLTEEVRKHNGFAERIPKLEAKAEQIVDDITDIKSDTEATKENIRKITDRVEDIERCQEKTGGKK